MEIHCRYTDAIFSPAEVQAMTGASVLLQNTWRRRGFLRTRTHGRASFNAREVAQILALRYLGQELQIGLDFVSGTAEKAAPLILWFALLTRRDSAWEIEEPATHEQKVAFKKAIEADLDGLPYIDKMIGVKRSDVRGYLVRTPTSSEFFARLSEPFETGDLNGAIFIDLEALGRQLAESTKRPFIIVSDMELTKGTSSITRRR